jgi:hypothetical protein
MEGRNWEVDGDRKGTGISGSGMGMDRRNGQMAMRMNVDLKLMGVGRCWTSPGCDRDLG